MVNDLEYLEQKHSLKILKILYDNGELCKGELSSMITVGTASVQSRIRDLVEVGLINEVVDTVKPYRKHISLTEKGEEVAKLIAQMDKLLQS